MKLTQIGVAVLFGFVSFSNYANPLQASSPGFQAACTETWMQKADDATDKEAYKKFGDKYCECAAKEPLDDDDAVQKAIRACMSKIFLRETMSSLEKELGLAKATDEDISQYCEKKWALVDPGGSEMDKNQAESYCDCAKPQVRDLIKRSETMTDEQYDEGIDAIASDCSSNAIIQQPINPGGSR